MMKYFKFMGKTARKIFLAPVRFYQKHISSGLGAHCNYTPSCSQYLVEAVEMHGILKGFILGVARLLRCSKYFMGGPDPVPEQFSFKAIRNAYIAFRRRPFPKSRGQRQK